MHCKACDKNLTESEDAAIFERSGVRVELCTGCAGWLPSDVGVLGIDVHSRLDEEAPLGREVAPWEDEE
jgi:hypothetical protein